MTQAMLKSVTSYEVKHAIHFATACTRCCQEQTATAHPYHTTGLEHDSGGGAHVVLGAGKGLDAHGLPPLHVVARLDQVVADPAGDGQEGHAVVHKVLLPADLHARHLVSNVKCDAWP